MTVPEYKDEVLDIGPWDYKLGHRHFISLCKEKGYEFYRFTDPANKTYIFKDSLIVKNEDASWVRYEDLKPKRVEEIKPYPKAFLAYNKRHDFWGWFIDEKDCPREGTPHRSSSDFAKGFLWNLSHEAYGLDQDSSFYGTWTSKDKWEDNKDCGGWVFDYEKKEQMKKYNTAVELQEAVMAYVLEKPSSRGESLQALRRQDFFVTTSLEFAENILTNFLNNPAYGCKEGREKAKKALGLTTTKWVTKELKVSEINALAAQGIKVGFNPRNNENREPFHKVSQTRNGTAGSELLAKVLYQHIPADYVMRVTVEEEV